MLIRTECSVHFDYSVNTHWTERPLAIGFVKLGNDAISFCCYFTDHQTDLLVGRRTTVFFNLDCLHVDVIDYSHVISCTWRRQREPSARHVNTDGILFSAAAAAVRRHPVRTDLRHVILRRPVRSQRVVTKTRKIGSETLPFCVTFLYIGDSTFRRHS